MVTTDTLQPKPKHPRDPNGTLDIARNTEFDEDDNHKKLLAQDTRVQRHYFGAQPHAAQDRLAALQRDDLRPQFKSEQQQRSLQKRNGSNKQTRARLDRHEGKRRHAAVAATNAEFVLNDAVGLLETEHDMERTSSIKQTQLKKLVDAKTAQHIYNLTLPERTYGMGYDRSGRYALLRGGQGHVAVLDAHDRSVVSELHVGERTRDACFLHSCALYAVAQQTHVYIYDTHGAEIHRLSEHNDPMRLAYLQYHWLLASVGRAGWLKYQDTSTGQLVSQHSTKLGPPGCLRLNPANAVLHAGHLNGTVTLWSPASSKYLAKILCHKGAAVLSLAMDPTGQTMVTGGADRKVRIWDLRMLQERFSYYCAAGTPTAMDISQTGLLGIAHAGHATVWSAASLQIKARDPYMHHAMPGCAPVETLCFRPFEDVCGIGHAKGISSIVIPGSGEPNLDTSEYQTNPMQDAKQRQEAEVRALLDKLQPDMIGLDADQVGGVEESDPHKRQERIKDLEEEANAKQLQGKKQKVKKRGRSKIQTKLRRKKQNIIDQSVLKQRDAKERAVKMAESSGTAATDASESIKERAPTALKRFF